MRVVTLTTVLAIVLSVDAKVSPGTQKNVCLNQEDGTFVADSNSCSSFIICYGGKPVSQDCEAGSYFDNKQLYCMPDTKNICSPSECKENGAYSAHPTDCSLFYICNAGKLVEQSCGEGSYFDSSKLFCKPDVDHICWPSTPSTEPCTCVGNYKEGEFVKDPDNCHSYFICFNGELVQHNCGFENYFDESTNKCARDINAQCWPKTCTGGLAEGDKVASYVNCSMYLECTHGELLQQNCPYQYFFDNSKKQCVRDEDGKCWEICDCPGGYKQGELVGNSANCSSYFHCDKGNLVPMDCGLGKYFDNSSKNCVSDTNGVCPTTEEPCTCDGGYEDGDFVPHKTSCYKFYICFGGKLVEQSCGFENYFDESTNRCARDINAQCWPQTKPPCTGGLAEGDRVASSVNCSMYLECTQGELLEQNCPYQYFFDNSKKQCARDEDGKCWEICDCPGGYKQGELVENSANCSSYFHCDKGNLVPMDCGLGNYFDNSSKNCVSDTNGVCPTTEPPCTCDGGYADGDFIPHNKNCYMFYICIGGKLVEESCGDGNYFDALIGSCALDTNGICWEKKSSSSSSSSSSSTKSTTTSSSTTTTTLKPTKPTKPSTTSEPPCICDGGYADGDFVPHKTTCYMFYVCIGGKLVEESCGYGNYFDALIGSCALDTNGICWEKKSSSSSSSTKSTTTSSSTTTTTLKPTKSSTTTSTSEPPCTCDGGYADGDFVPHKTTCYMFYVCIGGKLVEESCGYGNYFDALIGSCALDINGICWEKKSSSSSSSSSSSTKSTTTSSSTTTTTLKPTKSSTTTSTSEPPCTCDGGYADGDFVPHKTTCYMFYVCIGGKLVEESCGYGNYFDALIGSCVLDINGVCWKQESSSSSSTTTSKPTKTTTKSTTITSTTTPSTTTETKCPGGYENGELISNPSKCYSFFVCSNGYLIENSCKNGNYFDSVMKICVVDKTGICWPLSTSSSTSTTSTKKPKTTTTSTTTTTTPEAPCTCPGGYEDGQFVPHPSKCYLFYMCYNNELVEQSCGYGNYFDALSQSCILDINGICWSKTTSSSTKIWTTTPTTTKSTTTTSTEKPTTTTKSTTTTSTKKPTTTTKTTTTSTTTPSTTTTTEPCECPGGYKDGELVPHPSNCYKFYICYNSELVEESCGIGNYFDASSKSCVLDTAGICWPLDTTTRSTTKSTTTTSTEKPTTTTKSTTTTSTKKPTTTTKSTTTTSTKKPTTTTKSTTTSTTTTTEPCECAGGFKDGELVPHPSNCYKFYICYNSELVEESCGIGNYFDASSKSCVLDTAGICWPVDTTTRSTTKSTTTTSTEKPTTTTKSTTTTSTKKPTTTTKSTTTTSTKKPTTTTKSTTTSTTTTTEPCECPGGFKDGELVPHPSNCYKFYICYNSEFVEESCGIGNYFDASSKSCVLDTAGICWPLDTTTRSTTKSTTTTSTEKPTTTTKSTTTISTKKPTTTTKSTTTSTTTPSTTTTTEPCECPGGFNDGELVPHPSNCYKFYICYNSELVEESCGIGNYFDASSKSCVLDTAGICWPLDTTTRSTTKSTTTTSTEKPTTTTKSTTTTSTKKPTTTTKSTTTSTTTPSTTTITEPCECPGGFKDGELVPHPSNCYKFYICYNSELVEESCGIGNYFDASSKSCVLDTAGICWSSDTTTRSTTKSTTTTSTEKPTTTTKSTTTTSTKKPTTTTKSTTTTSTKKPTTTTKSTTTSTTTTTTEPCECHGGYEDGELVPHPSNCYKFYICYNGELVEESCGNGNYYDASSKSCVLDTAGKCWPSDITTSTTTSQSPTAPCTCPGGYEQGDFVPHPKNCFRFFICHQGNLSELSCGEGNYFNEHTKSCTLDTTGICWPQQPTPKPEPCKCPNGLEEGQFIADQHSCYKYSICLNGVLVGGNCGTGNLFNNDTKVCQPDTAGVCWPKDPTPGPTTPCVCPDGLEEGDRKNNPESCYMYFTCYQGNMIEGNCGTGNLFNNETKTCERDINNCCWPCTNGSMIANIEECDKFSICNDGKFVEQQCGTGYYFDVNEKYCVRDVNGTCWKVQAPSNTCQGANDGTLLPDPGACEKYFVCQNNKPVSQECGMGNLFNSTTLSCVHDTCGECWTKKTNVCANKTTGTFLPNSEHCDQFIVCHENHAIIQQCGSGNWFNPKSLLCEQDLYAKCINVCQNTEGITQLPHPNCNEFYLCENGLTKSVRTCLKGTNYDAIRGVCLASATCEENLCSSAPNGVNYPVRNDPSSFYSCYNKKPVKLNCLKGTSFDSERLICMPDSGLCIGKKNDFTIASKKNGNAYYVCKDNAAIFEQCPAHTVFDENKGVCVPALRKRVVNNICSTEADGTMLSGKACNKFHLCLDGESIEQNCGAYASFNPKLSSCVLDATCFNPNEICGKSSDIEKFPDTRDETSYIACKRGVATMEKCPKNTIYSHDIGSCVPKPMAIQKKELSEMCTQVPDKTITPALDCRKFYICSNRVATLQQCAIDQFFNITTGTCQADTGRQCWMRSETLRKSNFLRMIDDNDDYEIVCQECQKQHEPKIFNEKKVSFNRTDIAILLSPRSTRCSSGYVSLIRQSEKSCTQFYHCEDDQWKVKNCPLGKFFNSQLETCTNDSSFCDIQSTENGSCISNTIKSNEINCESYYVCLEGKWQNRHCAEGTYFNQTHGKCINSDGTCLSFSKLEHPCKNGTIAKKNFNSCSEYYFCVNGNLLMKKCPNGHYFNETFKACMLDDNGSCTNDIEHQKYIIESDRKFKPTNCTAFEIFLNNEWLTVHCPVGFYFDVSLNKCLINSGECLINGSLRQNCIEKTIQPSLNNFSEFYQCSNNEWHQESCMHNFRFDTIFKKCVLSNDTHDLMNVSRCKNAKDGNLQSGLYHSHETDCTKFYFCEDGNRIEGLCNKGEFFDSRSQRCQHDIKVCDYEQMTYNGICQNNSNVTFHQNPANCSTFYTCINMSALLTNCPQGEYFDAELGVCQIDKNKCIEKRHCNDTNRTQFPHETYCSIYYTCIGGKFIAIACEENYIFDSTFNKCVPDINHTCIDGLLKTSNSTDNLTADIPDSISCIGRQGDIMPDPKNCNKFYVCINEQLRHDKCFDGEFFNITKNSCTPKISNENCQNNTETSMKCSNSDREVNYADHTDCRKYFQCNNAELISKKCRNGESFDNLLGFCRQNDGTCLIENGQRVGACAGKHGNLVADDDNCLQYYTCINGQKIPKTCSIGEYFDKTASICEKDLNKTCSAMEDQVINETELSCDGLDELVFYPNTLDGCKSFFQCVKSIPIMHKCPDDFLYDYEAGACNWKENVNCFNK